MRKTFLYSVLFLLLLNISCEKENTNPENYILFEGEKYELSNGYMRNSGNTYCNDKEGTKYDILLGSSQEVMNSNGISGSDGNACNFWLVSPVSYTLEAGRYELTNETYGDAFDLLGISNKVLGESPLGQVIEGSVIVNKIGDNYEFTISCSNSEGKEIKAYFKGKIETVI